jgi:hypothetical protein
MSLTWALDLYFDRRGSVNTQGRLSTGVVFLLAILAAPNANSTIYYSKKEALELAFGKEALIETRSFFLTDKQIAGIEKIARLKLDSKLYTFYVGKRQNVLVGYAAIESHTVRTKPETLMIVLTPVGQLDRIYLLAFHEPPEYRPPERWFAQLYSRPLVDLELNRGVDGISGATLSSRSALGSARKVLALYQVLIAQKGQ